MSSYNYVFTYDDLGPTPKDRQKHTILVECDGKTVAEEAYAWKEFVRLAVSESGHTPDNVQVVREARSAENTKERALSN